MINNPPPPCGSMSWLCLVVLCCVVLCCLTLPCLALSFLALSFLVVSCRVLSCLVVVSCFVVSCRVIVLSCLALFRLGLSFCLSVGLCRYVVRILNSSDKCTKQAVIVIRPSILRWRIFSPKTTKKMTQIDKGIT